MKDPVAGTAAEVRILPDPAALAAAAAEEIGACADQALAARGRFVLGLSGGSTPRPLYELLASEPWASRLDWARILVVWCDERCVPADHPDSNYRLVHEALLSHVPLPPGNVHRMKGELPPPRAAAEAEAELRSVLGEGRHFDCALLGMGADGHTASLFPGTEALGERTRWVVANHVPALNAWRLTMTLTVLSAARRAVFLASGAEKRETLRRVLFPRPGDPPLPAALVAPREGPPLWLVDAAAAP